MPGKKIALVTGGAGFIGSHTADALKAAGWKVRILDNLERDIHTGKWPVWVRQKGFELAEGDVRRKSDWTKALRGVEAVYHLAVKQGHGLDFSRFFETNTTSTALLYEVIAEMKLPVRKVVLGSSQDVYGDGFYECNHRSRHIVFHAELRPWDQLLRSQWEIFCPHGKPAVPVPFREDQKVSPVNPYGISKYAAENVALRLGRTYEIPTVVMRYSIVQGPRQISPDSADPLLTFAGQALRGEPITVYEDGQQTRDLVDIRDAVTANLLVLRRDIHFEVFNVGSGRPVPIIELAQETARAVGSGAEITTGSFRRINVRHAISDVSKLEALGWRPRHGCRTSVESYLEWLRGSTPLRSRPRKK